jgi:hypothetical protein
MKTKIYIFLLVLSVNMNALAQSSINDYKYVSVNERFDFLKTADQYQLNSLTAFLFKKNGFTVVNKQNNYPQDLAQNNCLGLRANVISVKGFLKTKLQLVLTNCKENVVFTSEIGKSKLKNYKDAYYEALRDAFALTEFNYTYNGSASSVILPMPSKPTILPLVKEPVPVVLQVVEKTVPIPQVLEGSYPLAEVSTGLEIKQTNSGYDFIDSSSKKIKYSAHSTLFDSVYIVEGQAGIIYKRGQNWVREYIENGKTTIEALNIQR